VVPHTDVRLGIGHEWTSCNSFRSTAVFVHVLNTVAGGARCSSAPTIVRLRESASL
jgi:hypothetical protein